MKGDCRKKKEVISWSRWFNATLEKSGIFFPFLCNRVVLRQVISQGGWGDQGVEEEGKERYFPQVAV